MEKKLLLLLLLSVLMVGRVEDIYASSFGGGGSSFGNFTCACGGDFQTYYKLENLKSYYNCAVCHNADLSSCSFYVLYKAEETFEQYFIRYKCTDEGADGMLSYVTIFISDSNSINVYNSSGSLTWKSSSDFSTNLYGTSNGKYYFIQLYDTAKTVESFVTPVDYEVQCLGRQRVTRFNNLAKFLCGELEELPDGVIEETPKPLFDLEAPLNVKVNTGSASVNLEVGKYGTNGSATLIPHKIWWEQSNIDLIGYTTEFYVREYGKCRKSIFSKWEDCITGWTFDGEHVTAKYCNNNLKFHEYRSWESDNLTSVAAEQLSDDEPEVEFNSCDFMIRNKKVDDDGQTHYSNWVYVNTYEDGTYSVYEMVSDYDLDEDSDETGNIDTDSEIYDDEVIHTDTTDVNIDVGGVSNVGSFLTVMKDLANSIKTFPDFFAQVFSFLPNWILTSIGTLFVIILICAIF